MFFMCFQVTVREVQYGEVVQHRHFYFYREKNC